MKQASLMLYILAGLILFTLTLFTLPVTHGSARPLLAPALTATPPPPFDSADERYQVELAIRKAIEDHREYVLSYLVNESEIVNVQVSEDGAWATAWLVFVDPDTGEPLPSEPGLALAQRGPGGWQVTLPQDRDWLKKVNDAPLNLLSTEKKEAWLAVYETEKAATVADPFDGYLLPWAAGQTAWLSQSVLHDKYTPNGSAHYAFDFYVSQTLFNLHASKSGTVWRVKNDVDTCYEYHCDQATGNYIVIKDTSTNPVTFQLYLHLARDTIPAALLTIGAPVRQGQFIGKADNTGQSWGHHLHFQVHTNPNSYWGTSVDITFSDVAINGGRPRVNNRWYSDIPYCRPDDVCEEFQSSYVSGNTVYGDLFPPYGDMLDPLNSVTVQSRALRLEGWANDDESGLHSARFIAKYQDAWRPVGGVYTTNLFSYEWDLCAGNVPDGPLSLALEIWDKQGNPGAGLPGLTHVTKRYTCPAPPSCTPGDTEVALFADHNFGGNCLNLAAGDYPDGMALVGLGENNVASIMIGKDVLATMYSEPNYNGRAETFTQNDSNLDDNVIGANRLSSLKVRSRTLAPLGIPALVSPASGSTFTHNASISLSWQIPAGATASQVSLAGPAGTITSPWLAEPVWRLDGRSLPSGSYTWRVKSRNSAGETALSIIANTFTIASPSPTPTPVVAPFVDDMENGFNGWVATGLWNRRNDPNRAHSLSYSWYYGNAGQVYDTGSPNSGSLISPPITLPATETNYSLRFWSRYQTEGLGRHWDQRWLQISVSGGPFTNVLQIYDDPPNFWINPVVDLSAYAGSTIQVRFYFTTLDGAFNGYEGWYIDDFELTSGSMPACDNTGNNSPGNSIRINFDEEYAGVICPGGDIDYYKFSGTAGDRIVVDVDTPRDNPPDDLDLYLFLLDSDGVSVLAEHDDEVLALRRDPHLGFLLPRTGIYYLKFRLWSHPAGGGPDYTYTFRLFKDNSDPIAAFTYPPNGVYLPGGEISLVVSASDPPGSDAVSGSGVSHVEFLWHPSDWLLGDWIVLGKDWDEQDGWTYQLDTTSLAEQQGAAFYAKVYDWAGNWIGTGAWKIGIDHTPPVSALQPLAANQTSTAVQLRWNGSDNLSGIDHYNLQWQQDNGAWVNYTPDPGSTAAQAWFIGQASRSYGFRLRGVDLAGNTELYPSQAEVTTSIPNITTLCSTPDVWENNNTPATAKVIMAGGPPQTHNFCNPTAQDRLNDEDWLKFSTMSGYGYVVQITPLSDSAAVILELYAGDGATLLNSVSPQIFGEPITFHWTPASPGEYYLRLHHLDGRVAGNTVSYLVSLQTDVNRYLPLIFRPN